MEDAPRMELECIPKRKMSFSGRCGEQSIPGKRENISDCKSRGARQLAVTHMSQKCKGQEPYADFFLGVGVEQLGRH